MSTVRVAPARSRFGRTLHALNRRSLRVCRVAVGTALAVLCGVVLLQVVCRYLLDRALPWPEEVARLLMVWMTFLGAPVAYVRAEHARITLLDGRLGRRGRAILGAFTHAAVAAFAVTAVAFSVPVVRVGWVVQATTVAIPMAAVYVAFPIGLGLVALVALESAGEQLSMAGAAGPAQAHDAASAASELAAKAS